MENRKPLPDIQMEEKTGVLFIKSLFKEFFDGENKGIALTCDLFVFALCALLAGTHTVFGVFPLGFAYLALCRSRLFPALLGCIAGAIGLGSAGAVYIIVYILMFFARAYVSAPLDRRVIFPVCETYFSELLQLRFSLLIFVGLILSAYELAVGGINPTSLLFCLGMLTLPSLAAIFFLGVTESSLSFRDLFGTGEKSALKKTKTHPFYLQLSALAFCLSLIYALGRFEVFGLSLDYAFLTLSVFFVSKRFGALRASFLGILAALMLNIAYAPSFGALGLISGILWQFGAFYSFSVGSAAAVCWAGYTGGVEAFVDIAPEVCVVALLALPFFSRVRSEGEREKKKLRELSLQQQLVAVATPTVRSDRISRLSGALSGISNIFYSVPDTKKPTLSEYFEICEAVCEKTCATCSEKANCWDSQDRLAYRTVCKISDSLYSDGVIKKNTIPTEMFGKCCHFKRMVEEMLEQSAELGLDKIKGDKTRFISFDYAMMSKLLEQSAVMEKREFSQDESIEKLLAAEARAVCDEDVGVVVFGHRKKTVALGSYRADVLKSNAHELHERFEQTCGCVLTPPELCRTQGAVTMKMSTAKKLEVEYASASAPSGSGEVSGDRSMCFCTREDYFYSVISDGMGTGELAATASETAVSFLEKMLKAGVGKSLSLRMLNNIIRTKDKECSTTIDLLELDLIYGKTTFLKCGAAPSYVKRGEDIFVIKSRTSPIGLLKNTDAEKSDFAILPGDIIVMLSDGFVQGEDSDWLLSILSGEMNTNLSAAANELVAIAGQKTSCRDDTSVTLIKVKEALAG